MSLPIFLVFYAVTGVAFGWSTCRWAKRRASRGEFVQSPTGQVIFTAIAAPLALAVVLAFLWDASRTLSGLLTLALIGWLIWNAARS